MDAALGFPGVGGESQPQQIGAIPLHAVNVGLFPADGEGLPARSGRGRHLQFEDGFLLLKMAASLPLLKPGEFLQSFQADGLVQLHQSRLASGGEPELQS